uniref:Uncharacterized protein n=1 Tax=Avena sativa TaxID=4498 RepID=A0ACD5XD03_AVESA
MAEAAGAAVPEPLLEGLPDVISIWEILVRLPPKALLRCRAVCPAWRRATSTRDFLLAHHDRQPTSPLLYAYDRGLDDDDESSNSLDIIPFDPRAGVTTIDQLLLQPIVARLDLKIFYMLASCDGLLVLYVDFLDLCICNPATRQYASLPMLLRQFRLWGMYLHSPTGEYRLLLNKQMDLRHDDACHVFTIGSGQPPWQIGCPDGGKLICPRVPLLLHGNLHWHRIKSQTIVVFDTTAELFRQMRSPIVSDNAGLFEIGGMLGMSSLNNGATTMHIWVVQDYAGEVWSFKHRVELPVAQLSVQFGEFKNGSSVVVPSVGIWVWALAHSLIQILKFSWPIHA